MMPDNFDTVQAAYPQLIAINKSGSMTGNVVDFCKSYLGSVNQSITDLP